MPVLTQPISELTNHIFMPIIEQISHRLLASLNYADVIGNNIQINTDWSTHSKTSDDNDNAILGPQRFIVDAQLQMNPTSQKWDFYTFHHTAAYGLHKRNLHITHPVYRDDLLNIYLYQMISPVTIMMNCELILADPQLAFQTPQQIFNQHENGAVIHFNDLAFDFPVPKYILTLLRYIWRIDRAGGQSTGCSFYQYLLKHTDGTWQVHANRDVKDEFEIVIPQFDLKTLGSLEYSEDRPQGIMEGRLPSAFSIPFVYTVQFSLPTLMQAVFPITVDNQLLPMQFIPVDPNVRHNQMTEFHKGVADENYDKGMANQTTRFTGRPPMMGVKFPYYDDWDPHGKKLSSRKYGTFAQLAVLLDEDQENLFTSIDLSQKLDESKDLQPWVKEFLYQQGVESPKYDVFINISLFRDDKELLPFRDYVFTEDMKLEFTPISRMARYHIVISRCNNINYIHPKWYGLMLKYFAWLPIDIQKDIRAEIEIFNTQLNNPKYWYEHPWFCFLGQKLPNGDIIEGPIYVDQYGNVFDRYGHKLFNLFDIDKIGTLDGIEYEYGLTNENGDLTGLHGMGTGLIGKGEHYATRKFSRVWRADIIARKS